MAREDVDPDAFVAARDETVEAVVEFARSLRAAGVTVPANAAVVASRALAAVGLAHRGRVRAAMQATLVTRQEDLETFDALFERFWKELRSAGREPPKVLEELADAAKPFDDPGGVDPGAADHDGTDAEAVEERVDEGTDAGRSRTQFAGAADESALDAGEATWARYSPSGRSEAVSGTPVTRGDDLAEPVARLARALATLPGRRREAATSGQFVDARRALRASFQTGGVVASVPESDPADSGVRGVVLVDVSQSVLDSVDRAFLLEWLRLLVEEWRSTRVFFFDTDVREVTAAFDERTVGDVTDALAAAEAEWGGGTRIGHALARVRDDFPDAVDRRTVVVVVSDGLERGTVSDLAAGAAWVSRRARLFLWLNPLAASPEYEPVARGMAAALPAVDGLFAFAGPDDVRELARQLDRNDLTRLGYEYDPRRSGDATAVTDGGRAVPVGRALRGEQAGSSGRERTRTATMRERHTHER